MSFFDADREQSKMCPSSDVLWTIMFAFHMFKSFTYFVVDVIFKDVTLYFATFFEISKVHVRLDILDDLDITHCPSLHAASAYDVYEKIDISMSFFVIQNWKKKKKKKNLVIMDGVRDIWIGNNFYWATKLWWDWQRVKQMGPRMTDILSSLVCHYDYAFVRRGELYKESEYFFATWVIINLMYSQFRGAKSELETYITLKFDRYRARTTKSMIVCILSRTKQRIVNQNWK